MIPADETPREDSTPDRLAESRDREKTTSADTFLRTPHDALWAMEQLDSVGIPSDWTVQRHVATDASPASLGVVVTAWIPEEVAREHHRDRAGKTLIASSEGEVSLTTREQVTAIVRSAANVADAEETPAVGDLDSQDPQPEAEVDRMTENGASESDQSTSEQETQPRKARTYEELAALVKRLNAEALASGRITMEEQERHQQYIASLRDSNTYVFEFGPRRPRAERPQDD